MKLNSPLFDRIRAAPRPQAAPPVEAPRTRGCEWPACRAAGTHRAPKGRDKDGEYWWFCLDHVRDYNQSYNYFSGMTPDEVAAWQKASITGHRPTWKIGVAAPPAAAQQVESAFAAGEFAYGNPFRVFTAERVHRGEEEERRRTVRNGERQALATLGLDVEADKAEIKARFKELAKRHHPDANGGDTSTEDKLRDIIAAYNYLKSAGLC